MKDWKDMYHTVVIVCFGHVPLDIASPALLCYFLVCVLAHCAWQPCIRSACNTEFQAWLVCGVLKARCFLSTQSTTRLDSDRVSSASSTAERGMVKPMIRVEQQPDYRRQESRTQDASGPELILPASIEFRESSEDSFLSAIINYTNSSTVHFKLSPTYVLYMACRYVLSNQYRPDISPTERTHKVIAVVNKMVSMMEGVIQEVDQVDQKQKNIAGALAFWMANASELLNFIKQDRDLSRITLDAQDVLAHLVQMAFKYLVHCLQSELNNYMPAFLDDPEENSLQRPKIDDVLHTLTGAMSLLRRCRVNAALTIQLFSQLFHFINMWLFNRLVTDPDSGLCSHYWGAIIRQQLGHIEAWAEKQGLELAADCHLSRIVQATTLLTMDKYAPDDIPNINSTCFKLNSLQLQALLQNYHCAPDEPFIPTDLIENVVAVAENTADELARSDGREVQLEEDPDLQLPFLLPEDGYSCDVVRNIPNGLQEFLDPLCQRGFCRLIPHTRSPGTWTIYFEGADYESHLLRENTELAQPLRKEPEIITVTLKKQNGMGLSIVAAK
ncbi:Afadin, partial [Plecturocebus cupreus]